MIKGGRRTIDPDGGGDAVADPLNVVVPTSGGGEGSNVWLFAGGNFFGGREDDNRALDVSLSSPSSPSSSFWTRRPSWISGVGRHGNGNGDDIGGVGGWATIKMTTAKIPSFPSISSVLSSMSSLNPFATSWASRGEDKESRANALVAEASAPPSSPFLPRFASRFGWATTATATRRRTVVGLGRWDRFATYNNHYYPYLCIPDPFGMGAYGWPRHPDGFVVFGERGYGDGGEGVEQGRDESSEMMHPAAAPSIDGEKKNKNDRSQWWQWWWLWLWRRRTRPSEASVEAAWREIFSVRRQMMLALAMEVEKRDGDDKGGEVDDGGGGAHDGDDDDGNDGRRRPRDRLRLLSSSFDSETSCDPTVIDPRSSPARRSLSSIEVDDDETPDPPLGQDDAIPRGAAEVAARLAEGALRAYRDLTLDEAVELHSALHHWTLRWMHPLLALLEAGPYAWFLLPPMAPGHYLPPHVEAGKKVGQIQTVLARRCAVIGELQQHLWRASWQKGVAEWGMLGGGLGGEWTSVVGEFGCMDAAHSNAGTAPSFPSTSTRKQKRLIKIFSHSNLIGTNVSNSPGGSIVMDQNALATWSIDAMRVIRDQLYRARRGVDELPFVEHWPRERRHFLGSEGEDIGRISTASTSDLPLWASSCNSAGWLNKASRVAAKAAGGTTIVGDDDHSSVVITDLGKMTDEVSALLKSIEVHLEQQRERRLDRLRPPSRLRRNWYLIALGVPVGAYAVYKLTREHGGFFLLKTCITKIADIYRDHVSEPLESIYKELFTKSGRMNVTDRKARIDAIESLKRMIRSWLEESFPNMSRKEMTWRAETMDISLLEARKEASIKNIYELNSVVRMSLIEMQFIKKELLNALVAMDELMGSNEINMRIAAMTPAFILLYSIRRGFQLLLYGFFRVGKTKEQIYGSFRQTVLDIERLLLMRDNPPSPPDPLEWGSRPLTKSSAVESCESQQFRNSQTLSAEDLGMLLLHIHECRNILWESRRRFRSDVIRNVAEDLAELAGERGPVSVSQQLAIISRMSRTYPFMKVVSSGIPFDMIIPRAG